jgi:hypothetical protein
VTLTDHTGAIQETHTCACGGTMIRLEVESRLSVHLPGDSSAALWTMTPLDGFTCTTCGRTEFFARSVRHFQT